MKNLNKLVKNSTKRKQTSTAFSGQTNINDNSFKFQEHQTSFPKKEVKKEQTQNSREKAVTSRDL